jgi:flagellar biosynthesis/type III secretory pathway protein FliH
MSSVCLRMNVGMTRLVATDPTRVTVRHAEAAPPREDLRQAVEQARQEAAAAVATEREKCHRLRQTLETRLEGFMRDAEDQIREQLIGMSLRIAEIILKRELPDRQMIRSLIRETLEPVSDMQGAKIRLHPADAEMLLKTGTAQDGSEGLPDRLEIVADKDLQPGDALIESRNGYFDARLAERLSLLKERLCERQRNPDVRRLAKADRQLRERIYA